MAPRPLQELVYRLYQTEPGSDAHVAAVRRCYEAIHAARAGDAVCRVCGCTEMNCQHCRETTGERCHWVEPDLCSACSPGHALASAATEEQRARAAEALETEM